MRKYLFFLLLFKISALQAQVFQQIPLITVSGSAAVSAVPDIAIITLERIFDPTLINQVGNDFYSTLNNESDFNFLFLNKPDINWCFETINFNKDKLFIKKNVIITLNDISKLKEVIAELLKLKKYSLVRVEYRTSKLNDFKNNARLLALSQARRNAGFVAKEMGVEVGRLFNIIEKSSPMISHYEDSTQSIDMTNIILDTYIVNPGYISIISNIEVSYEIKY